MCWNQKNVVEMSSTFILELEFLSAGIKSLWEARSTERLLEGLQVSYCHSLLCYPLEPRANGRHEWTILSQHHNWVSRWPQAQLPSNVAELSRKVQTAHGIRNSENCYYKLFSSGTIFYAEKMTETIDYFLPSQKQYYIFNNVLLRALERLLRKNITLWEYYQAVILI